MIYSMRIATVSSTRRYLGARGVLRNLPSARVATRALSTKSESWQDFSRSWNQSLERRPLQAISLIGLLQSGTWLVLFSAMGQVGVACPPSWAAGWVCARLLRRVKQPLNFALAAGMVRLFPRLGDLKVSPLVTGIVMNNNDNQQQQQAKDELPPALQSAADKLTRGIKWLEGPVDRYGMAYVISSRLSGVGTMATLAVLIEQGVDVQGVLASYGFSETFGDDLGTAALASAVNVAFLPYQYWAMPQGIQWMERTSTSYAKHALVYQEEDQQKGQHGGRRQFTEDEFEENGMNMLTLLLYLASITAAIVSMKKVGVTTFFGGKHEKDQPEEDDKTNTAETS